MKRVVIVFSSRNSDEYAEVWKDCWEHQNGTDSTAPSEKLAVQGEDWIIHVFKVKDNEKYYDNGWKYEEMKKETANILTKLENDNHDGVEIAVILHSHEPKNLGQLRKHFNTFQNIVSASYSNSIDKGRFTYKRHIKPFEYKNDLDNTFNCLWTALIDIQNNYKQLGSLRNDLLTPLIALDLLAQAKAEKKDFREDKNLEDKLSNSLQLGKMEDTFNMMCEIIDDDWKQTLEPDFKKLKDAVSQSIDYQTLENFTDNLNKMIRNYENPATK